MGKDPYQKNRPKPPGGIREIPRFVREMVVGFFTRLSYIFQMVWKTGPWILFVMMFTAVFSGVMPIVGSLLSKEILNELQAVISDRVAAEVSGAGFFVSFWGSMVMFLLIFYFLYRILNQVVNRLSTAVTRIAGEKVVRHVRLQIMNKAKELDLASFDLPEFYEKLENANREAGNRPISVLSATFDAISKLISLISYIVVLATAPGMWWTAPVMILISIPTAVVNFTYKHKTFLYLRRRSKDRRQMNYYSDLMVNKDMVKEIRMYDLADQFIERYDNVFQKYYLGMRKLIVRESFWQIALTFLSAIVNCLFFGLIAIQVFNGTIQIGDYSLYTGALTSIATTVAGLINVSATVYEGTLFIDNLIAFVKERPTVIPSTDAPASVAHGQPHTIEFVDVSFAYPGSDRRVLNHINLKFRPGETVVLVGLNGAGKTTFIKLLTRLYDPTEGKILLDGKDLKEYDPKDLYRMFGIIFQDFGKYAVSVSDNIRFGDIRREAEPSEIREAAVAANADDFITRLPEEYNTPLMRFFEPDGIELSIGQWQKLAIARAFYSESDILILDEPTASLDPMAEQEIFNQFDRLRQDKTTIFVSHRLSSATVASKIVVLEYGELIEEGTHKELMEKKGRYYELFSTQARRYLEEKGDPERDRGHRPTKKGAFPQDFS
ncbi:MAG: ABC transporter ATP-binding protein [Clostridia bacterium]|nr:ABC transporter ATP-binding protein [Clostridia bacterium]